MAQEILDQCGTMLISLGLEKAAQTKFSALLPGAKLYLLSQNFME